MVDNIELVKLNSNINTEFELLSKGFSRVITDVEKLTSAFHETESLHNVGSIDKIIDVVEHTGVKTLHAELAIIQHRMCELNPDGDEYIESVELLQGYVGVSKLSCEECYAVFTLLGLSKYVAGGHGVLFYNLWHLPQWELEEQVDSMVVYIKQHLEKRVDASVIPITDGVEFSELCHDFSDDEEDAPKSGHLTQEKYRDGFNWFKKCLSKMHHIGYSHDTSGFGIDRMMDSAVSYSPVECPIKSNDETHHNTPSIGTPIELYCNAKHHLEKRTSDCSSDTCIPSSIDGDQVSHHKSVQRHDSALRCIDKDNDNTPPLDLVACETTWSHDSI